MNIYSTGVGSRHTVSFPDPEWWLDDYEVVISWDESRNSYMATVTLWNYPESGGFSSEVLVIYRIEDESQESIYRALAEALKLSEKPWKIRKLWYSVKNRRLRNKLENYGWHDQD